MVVLKEGNTALTPLEIILGRYQDSDCGMVIDKMDYVSQVISNDGKTWFFHDHGGMANWLKDKSFKDDAKIWVMSIDTKQYINGRTAWYSRTDNTPMRYGFFLSHTLSVCFWFWSYYFGHSVVYFPNHSYPDSHVCRSVFYSGNYSGAYKRWWNITYRIRN
jgi:hypothetical protein